MDTITNTLLEFDTITLAEMENVKLMDRTDTKYNFNFNALPDILQGLQTHYKVLNVEGHKLSRYKTLYYDTEDFKLYNQHHNGKYNRYKIRHRTYVESKLSFLEVKFKSNKGRTLKTRIKENTVPTFFEPRALGFLQRMLPFDPLTLTPKIWVNYNRVTLVNKITAERLTLDLNLEFESNNSHKAYDDLVIAEVKRSSKFPSPFVSIMRELHIRESGISKYCFAVASSFTDVKKNNFKAKILNIQKSIQQ